MNTARQNSSSNINSDPKETKTTADIILENQKAIKKEIKEINDRNIQEQDEKAWLEKSNIFITMSSTLFNRAAREGALSQSESEMCSGLMMMGIGYAMPVINVALICMGAFQFAMGLLSYGADDEEFVSAHYQTMQALHELARMIENHFKQLFENQALIYTQLKRLEAKVDRVEALLGKTAQESYLNDYLTLTNRLNYFLYNKGITASTIETTKDLRDLQSWLSPAGHCYKSTVTGTIFLSGKFDPTYHLVILGNNNFDNLSMLGYMTSLLELLAPHRLTDAMKVKLPNFSIFVEAATLYRAVIEKHHPVGNIAVIFTEIAEQFQVIANYFSALSKNSILWESLSTQINAYARQASQYLAILEKTNKFSGTEGTIFAVLTDGVEKTKLLTILDNLEVRRLLMGRFCELLGNPKTLLARIAALPSKVSILTRTRLSLQEANKQLSAAGEKGDVEGVKAALLAGADYSSIIRYPSVLRGDSKQNEVVKRKHSLEIFDLLIRFSSTDVPLKKAMTTFITHWPSSWITSCPINTMLRYGCFEQLILAIANGLDISEATTQPRGFDVVHYGVGTHCKSIRDFKDAGANVSSIQYQILLGIVRDVNKPEGVLNKDDLRQAYSFYRSCQDDDNADMTQWVNHTKPHVLVWLTALLGDVKPLQELQRRGKVISPDDTMKGIPYDKGIFLPMQLAVQLGHREAVIEIEKLSDNGIPVNLKEPVSDKAVVTFAEEQNFWEVGFQLCMLGYEHPLGKTKFIGSQLPSKTRSLILHPQPAKEYPSEPGSLGPQCASLSQSFALASKRANTSHPSVRKTFPILMKMISERKYAEAARHILKVLLPTAMSMERAEAYLQDFARHDFVGVVLAKINSEDPAINDLLKINLEKTLNIYRAKGIHPGCLELANAISDEIKKIPIKTPFDDEKIIKIIEKSIITIPLPEELEFNIKAGLWKVVMIDIKDLDESTKEKLLPYLLVTYANAFSKDRDFCDLIAYLKKETGMEIYAKPDAPEKKNGSLPKMPPPAAFFQTKANTGSSLPPSKELFDKFTKFLEQWHLSISPPLPGTKFQQLNNEALLWGFQVKEMKRDGNCFYHAISDQMRSDAKGQQQTHEELREITVKHVLDNLNYYRDFIQGDLDTFIDDNAQTGKWAEDIMPRALARALNCNLVIINSDGSIPIIIKRSEKSPIYYLGYEVAGHYNSLDRSLMGLTAPKKDIDALFKKEPVDKFNETDVRPEMKRQSGKM